MQTMSWNPEIIRRVAKAIEHELYDGHPVGIEFMRFESQE
jgi:hypothetical protein